MMRVGFWENGRGGYGKIVGVWFEYSGMGNWGIRIEGVGVNEEMVRSEVEVR